MIKRKLYECGAMTYDGITYAAMILFGKNASPVKYLPQAEIVFEYRSYEASGAANQRVFIQDMLGWIEILTRNCC